MIIIEAGRWKPLLFAKFYGFEFGLNIDFFVELKEIVWDAVEDYFACGE